MLLLMLALAARADDPAPLGPVGTALSGRQAVMESCYRMAREDDPGLEANLRLRLLVSAEGGVQRIAVGIVTTADLAGLPQGQGTRPWLQTGTATGTGGGIPVNEGQNARSGGSDAGIPPAVPPAVPAKTFPLPYREPTPAEQMQLVALYDRKGSKNKTLAVAYAQGKTPKSLGWLDKALSAMGVRA